MTNTIFFGSDRFSAVVLGELIRQNHPPQLVVTDQPKPKGKKGVITPNEVDILANTHNVKVLYYPSKNDNLIKFMDTTFSILNTKYNEPKIVGLSASFPHLFPPDLIAAFGGELYNLHPSLLPQYRNVAPVPYALALGDTVTGVTLQRIDEKIDHGRIVAQASAPILPADYTPTLLTRLFTLGTNLFLNMLAKEPLPLPLTSHQVPSNELVFTRKLRRETGFVEWDVIQKLLQGYALKVTDTANPLIKLRLTLHPDRTQNILPDLIRALDGYEKVWTIAPTKKGNLAISLTYDSFAASSPNYTILVPGKPRPIPYTDFIKHYL